MEPADGWMNVSKQKNSGSNLIEIKDKNHHIPLEAGKYLSEGREEREQKRPKPHALGDDCKSYGAGKNLEEAIYTYGM